MITKDKITEIFCILDEFSKNFDEEIQNHSLPTDSQKPRRRRKASLSDSEIMTILPVFHFGTFANFKHYYLHFIKVHLRSEFPSAVSYNRFVELES
ncbi:IS982 family transposase, partial [Tannerella forsythia]